MPELNSIGAVSKITGVSLTTLRYWEREFSTFLSPTRSIGGQRMYSPKDVSTIFAIKKLLREDLFSIKGAKVRLARREEELSR